MSGSPMQKNEAKDGALDCRGPRGSKSSSPGLVDNPSQIARWRSILERYMEKNPAFQPLMIQLDNGDLHSPRDIMRALAKASPDSSGFRAIADEIIQSVEANEKFLFTKASIFQQLAVHGSSMDAAALADLMDLSRPLGLDAEQTANMQNLADNIAKQNGLGSVDSSLNFMANPANPASQPIAADAAQTIAQQNPSFPQAADQSPIEFENERYNKKAGNGASTTTERSSSPVSSVHGPSSAESDFAGFMMVREAQAKASGPAAHELTTLERSALSLDRKEETSESTRISDQDKQSALSDGGKPNEYMIDLQSKDPIERLKFFFANMLGIQPSNDSDDKGGSDTFPKGPPSCPPIKVQTATTAEAQEPKEKTIRAAVVLQPMEPLTFRLRQGRFVTASSLALTPPALSQDRTVSPVAGKVSQKPAEKTGGPQIDPKKTSPVSVIPSSTPRKKNTDAKPIESKMVAKQKAEAKKKDIRKKFSESEREKKEQRKKAESGINKSNAPGRAKSANRAGQLTAPGEKRRRDEHRPEEIKKRYESASATAKKTDRSLRAGKTFTRKDMRARSIPMSKARSDINRNAGRKRTTVSLVTSDKKPRKKPVHRL